MSIKKTGDSNPLVYMFGKTWEYSRGNRGKVVWYWIMFIAANSMTLIFEPIILAKIMNTIQTSGITHGNIKSLLGLLSLLFVLEMAFWSLHGPARCIERNNAFKARMNYRERLLRGVLGLPLGWHADHHSGDTIDKIEKGTNSLFSFAESSFIPIWGFLQLIVSIIMLFIFGNSSAVSIVLLMLIISFWITIRFDRVMIPQYKDLNHAENKISESVFDTISNITTVIILRVEKLVFQGIMKKVEKPFGLFTHNQLLNEAKWFLTSTCCTVMTISVLSVYFWQSASASEGVLIGSVFLLMKYLDKISQLFFRFTSDYSDIVKQKSRVMNAEELTGDFRSESLTNHVLPSNWKNLKVQNLNFSYDSEEGQDMHLEDINFSLQHGEKVAFIGESGSGKTTLLKLIRDLHSPARVNISCDGKSIPEGFEGISRAISLIPQNPEIFSTTILQNITLGANYPQGLVDRFVEAACFKDVVCGLPNGFDSSIKEKGVNLSGGQQQRLALARGLLASHDKDIVLLDEPTSSLDTATEMAVYTNIFREFKDKTVISSIHRLHLLSMFDTIYMFKDGKILASGTLEELRVSCVEFQTLWNQYYEKEHAMA